MPPPRPETVRLQSRTPPPRLSSSPRPTLCEDGLLAGTGRAAFPHASGPQRKAARRSAGAWDCLPVRESGFPVRAVSFRCPDLSQQDETVGAVLKAITRRRKQLINKCLNVREIMSVI